MKENLKSNLSDNYLKYGEFMLNMANLLLIDNYLLAKSRNSRPGVFCKTGVLRNLAKFTGNTYSYRTPLDDCFWKSRLESLEKRFNKNKELFIEYDKMFHQYLKDIIIEKVPN